MAICYSVRYGTILQYKKSVRYYSHGASRVQDMTWEKLLLANAPETTIWPPGFAHCRGDLTPAESRFAGPPRPPSYSTRAVSFPSVTSKKSRLVTPSSVASTRSAAYSTGDTPAFDTTSRSWSSNVDNRRHSAVAFGAENQEQRRRRRRRPYGSSSSLPSNDDDHNYNVSKHPPPRAVSADGITEKADDIDIAITGKAWGERGGSDHRSAESASTKDLPAADPPEETKEQDEMLSESSSERRYVYVPSTHYSVCEIDCISPSTTEALTPSSGP